MDLIEKNRSDGSSAEDCLNYTSNSEVEPGALLSPKPTRHSDVRVSRKPSTSGLVRLPSSAKSIRARRLNSPLLHTNSQEFSLSHIGSPVSTQAKRANSSTMNLRQIVHEVSMRESSFGDGASQNCDVSPTLQISTQEDDASCTDSFINSPTPSHNTRVSHPLAWRLHSKSQLMEPGKCLMRQREIHVSGIDVEKIINPRKSVRRR
eukprot:CAMPEP_0115036256 /NCGR_PEP_ID=MMETSP0216-20121206/41998_1 /TAXON_ID=223996 /ORGANISM="Protocruzia adherens, Strain Boccale" /LENGTH=205 /DNA_ID=CAMNT_0002416017 /DNA_START=173 /DNA_END=790 /DNA_ORIENTATION=-